MTGYYSHFFAKEKTVAMPTYEYECQKCKKTFDVFQNIKDKPLRTCPTCKGRMKRCIGTGAGILFKGSGFYQTDYRSESYRKKAKEEAGSSSKPASESTGSAKKTESSSSAANAKSAAG